MNLRDYIDQARDETKPRRRSQWTEADYQTALNPRLSGAEAGRLLGCTGETVNTERREWIFEWN